MKNVSEAVLPDKSINILRDRIIIGNIFPGFVRGEWFAESTSGQYQLLKGKKKAIKFILNQS